MRLPFWRTFEIAKESKENLMPIEAKNTVSDKAASKLALVEPAYVRWIILPNGMRENLLARGILRGRSLGGERVGFVRSSKQRCDTLD
ncbi:MAG TPA: hypothetical protein DDW52_08090 [Planctomycetaceae bacterium]|nr:hypothetical protein [Planctomycetaceae bacterium]